MNHRQVLLAALMALPMASFALPELPKPLLNGMEPAVVEQLNTARSEFDDYLQQPDLNDHQLSDAYGEIGQVYHAQNLQPTAEAAYRAAIELNPKAFRWHYLLGYLLQQQARLDAAAAAYTAALALRPTSAPLLVRFGQLRLGQGDNQRAAELFLRALDADPAVEAVAAYGIGKAEAAQGRPELAVTWFERALQAEPRATRVHYALAMAWRRAGDVDAARRHLGLRGDVEPKLPDPLVTALTERTGGARVRQYRAMQAVAQERFDDARREFRAIVNQNPGDARARVSLARTMVVTGDSDAAAEQLAAAVALSPRDDHANYFYGRLLQDRGKPGAAEERYRVALATNPDHAGAQFFLGGLLVDRGDYGAAATCYRRVVELMPERLDARRLLIASSAAAGDWSGAKAAADDALQAYGDEPGLALAQARLLAASPDPALRDGATALGLSRSLFDHSASIENAEAVAMAYAELGQYRNARAFQQAAIDAAQAYGAFDLLEGLEFRLAIYSENRPLRTPWSATVPRFLTEMPAGP